MDFRPFKVYVEDDIDRGYPVLAIRETSEGTELLLPNKSSKLKWVKMRDVTVCNVYPMK
jgi:hypothetical protein